MSTNPIIEIFAVIGFITTFGIIFNFFFCAHAYEFRQEIDDHFLKRKQLFVCRKCGKGKLKEYSV